MNQMNPMQQQYSEQGADVERYNLLQDQFRELSDKYSAMFDARKQDLETIATLTRAVATLESVKIDSDRKDKLRDLAEHYAIDAEAEYEKCLYSLGSEMNDQQFTAHIETIERYAQKRVSPMLPTGELLDDVSKEKYSEERCKEIVDYATDRGLSWEAAVAELAKAK